MTRCLRETLVSDAQAGRMLQVSRNDIMRMLERGKLSGVQTKHRVYVLLECVIEHLRAEEVYQWE